jgi:WD40 repeat protein
LAALRGWRESVGNWLYLVAYRLALRVKAEARRRARCEAIFRNPASSRNRVSRQDPLEYVTGRELCAALDEELSRLPEAYRAGIVACCLEGQTRDEAARSLGWSPRTLKRRLERGRALLRRRLEQRGFALPATLAGALMAEGVINAAIPTALVRTTVTAALTGTAASARVLAMANAFLARAFLSRLRAVAVVLLAASLVSAGLGGLAVAIGHPALVHENPQSVEPPQSKPQPAPQHVDAYGDPLPAEAVARLGTLRLYHGQQVDDVILSPDAKLVVSFSRQDGNRLWDAITGRELPLKESLRMTPVFTAKGKLLALEGSERGELVCQDLASSDSVRLPRNTPGIPKGWPNTNWQQDLVSPDGAIRAAIKENRIHLCDARSGKELDAFAEENDKINGSLAFSPDSKLLAASDPRGVRLWDVGQRKFLRLCRAKDFQVFRVVFSEDGKTLAAADGNSVTLWDVATGKWRHEFHHMYLVGALAFLPDGKTILSGSSYNDPIIRLWDPFTGREKGQWRGHTVDVQTLAVTPDGKLAASGGQDKTLRLWDVAAGKELRQFGDGKETIWKVAFSPDRKMLAAGGKVVHLWDPATGEELRTFGGGTILRVAFSVNGKTLATAASDDGLVRLWDVGTGQELRTFGGQSQQIPTFAFSPEGKTLATGDPAGPIHLWDLTMGKEIRTIGEAKKPDPRAAYTLGAITFSPDGRVVAAGYSDEMVKLWEVASGQERARFHGHRSGVVRLVYSPDGRLLASGSWDRTAVIWDVMGQRAAPRLLGKLEPEKLNALWDDLAGPDASKAYRAIRTLSSNAPQASSFLKEHLRPAIAADAKRVAGLVAELDGEEFAARERATKELQELGEAAEPALRAALEGQPSAELRRRAQSLLARTEPGRSPELLRGLRAIEVLERIATPEAGQLLQKLADGSPDARLTGEAKAALARLARR